MKSDLVFKIGTLCSFFLIGIDYISDNIFSGIFLKYFIIVIILIIFLSVAYCIYNFFTYKEISFKIIENDIGGYKIYCSNNSQYRVIITDIIIYSNEKNELGGADEWEQVDTTYYLEDRDSTKKPYQFYYMACLSKTSMSFFIRNAPKITKSQNISISYILTNNTDALYEQEILFNEVRYLRYEINRKLTFFEKRAIKKQK